MKLATNSKDKWTKDDIATLEQMIMDGAPYSEISKKLGRSLKSIEWAKSKYLHDLVTKYKSVNYIPTP